MRKNYYQENDDESELPDLDYLAKQNIFDTDDEPNWGADHLNYNLPNDNAITYQDPNARLSIDQV